MEYYVYIKALHVIFVITWFAALFYMPRLLIYHVEADLKQEPEKGILSKQFKIMQKRLWYAIGWPSMILTIIFGSWMLALNPDLVTQAWFILKMIFVGGLVLYHIQTHLIFANHQKDILKWSSFSLRLWNEVATVFLFAIIFLVIPKQNSDWVWVTLGIILLAALLLAAVAIYKIKREKKK
ncbi:MAG TPA: CopD family protein [Bacteroidia bacterium]|jgi:putative membrane protein|nr:CopD family protein [Bacteroidia bacterium]